MISGSRAGYTYLASTIPRFYDARALAALLHEAGFEPVSFKRSLFGAAAIHLTVKPHFPRPLRAQPASPFLPRCQDMLAPKLKPLTRR